MPLVLLQPGFGGVAAEGDELVATNDEVGEILANSNGGFVDVTVLDNDVYGGIPVVQIVSQASSNPGLASVQGSGEDSVIRVRTDQGSGVGSLVYSLNMAGSSKKVEAAVHWAIVTSAGTYDGIVETASTFGNLAVWLKGTSATDARGTLGTGTIS